MCVCVCVCACVRVCACVCVCVCLCLRVRVRGSSDGNSSGSSSGSSSCSTYLRCNIFWLMLIVVVEWLSLWHTREHYQGGLGGARRNWGGPGRFTVVVLRLGAMC